MKFSQLRAPGIATFGVLVAIGFILIADGTGMSMFSKLVLFSHVEGVVTLDGKPVEGAEIVQEILYKDAKEVAPRTVKTGAQGEFELEEVTRSPGLSRLLPGQVSIVQRLLIKHDGKEYEGWRHNKSSVERNSELDGQPLELVCELNSKPDFEGTHFGICRTVTD